MDAIRVKEKINECANLIIRLIESQSDFSVNWDEHHFNVVEHYSSFHCHFQNDVISISYSVNTDYHHRTGNKTSNIRQETIEFKPAAIEISSGAWLYLSKPETIIKKVIEESGTMQVSNLSKTIIKLESEERSNQFGILVKKLSLLLRFR